MPARSGLTCSILTVSKNMSRRFKPELTKEKYFSEKPVDPTQSIVTEDLQELKTILGRGVDATQFEINRVIKLLQGRGENYRYFFLKADEPMWLPYLKANGLFDNPPQVEQIGDGGLKIPDWPPIYYLERVFASAREEVPYYIGRNYLKPRIPMYLREL